MEILWARGAGFPGDLPRDKSRLEAPLADGKVAEGAHVKQVRCSRAAPESFHPRTSPLLLLVTHWPVARPQARETRIRYDNVRRTAIKMMRGWDNGGRGGRGRGSPKDEV